MAAKTTTIKPDRKINKVGTTTDNLTDRGGLTLFNQYLFQIGILDILADMFGFLRQSAKGMPIWRVFHQLLCFFFDGTNLSLSWFDVLKEDAGYAATIETDRDNMATSHQMKRFLKSVTINCWRLFRMVLLRLFIWRLRIEKPDVIEALS